MKKWKNWIYGGIIGLLLGIISFSYIAGSQFINKINEIGVWLQFIVVILEPTLAGILIPLAYNKLIKSKSDKEKASTGYAVIIGLIIVITIIWLLAFSLVAGIIGL
ncbi:MAG: hypothetical protein U9O94_09890 [Nanoarchaeota archaeon]|nr:hypothetical protein [Nanoarchaeota archaeon]